MSREAGEGSGAEGLLLHGAAEGAGVVSSGEKEAQGRYYSLQLKDSLLKLWQGVGQSLPWCNK